MNLKTNMKIKQTNSEGVEEEVEVMTPAEVDAKLASEKAALEESHKKQLEEVSGKVSAFEQEKAELQKKIDDMIASGMNADNPSFKILKEALTKKDTEISEIKKTLAEDKTQRVKEEIDSKIKIASKGNIEVEKKIRYHLEKTLPGLPEGTAEERKTKLEAAFKLASDGSSDGPGMFDMGAGGGGYGAGSGENNGNTVEFTAKERALGAKLGLTAEDYKKYGPRVSKKINN